MFRRNSVRLAAVLAMMVPALAAAQQQGVRGEATVTTTGGYGRIVIRTAGDVESQVRMTSGILVIQFPQPVTIAVDRLGAAASEYIGAARRDPDGRALRFALTQKVKVNSMTAGDRLFVDLLPESWSGEPPGLPREVVEELARKANEAERAARQKIAAEEREKKIPSVRVRVAAQPTFTRYIFELPELTGVTAERAKDQLTLGVRQGAALRSVGCQARRRQDRGRDRCQLAAPTAAQVQFKFGKAADIRTFREDSNYVVDVSPIEAKAELKPDAKPETKPAGPLADVSAPETVPAKTAEAKPPAVAPTSTPHAGHDAQGRRRRRRRLRR